MRRASASKVKGSGSNSVQRIRAQQLGTRARVGGANLERAPRALEPLKELLRTQNSSARHEGRVGAGADGGAAGSCGGVAGGRASSVFFMPWRASMSTKTRLRGFRCCM